MNCVHKVLINEDDQGKKAEGKNSEEEEEKGRLCGSVGTIANVGGAF
jgi:hypothetical protein